MKKLIIITLVIAGCSSAGYNEKKADSKTVGDKYKVDTSKSTYSGAYIGNIDTAAVNKEKQQKLQEENEKKQAIIDALAWLEPKAAEYEDYYFSKMRGKTFNQIADMFYDEGFSRSYNVEGSNYVTTYSKIVYDEGDNMIYIWFDVWHSYGYGRLEATCEYNITAEGKIFNYWIN